MKASGRSRRRRRSSASSAARSTPASPRRRGWSRSSTASTPSARPARPTSPASGPRAGCWSPTATTTAASPARTLERPALKRLLADIEAKRVDVVVVYKIDRLSRSLMDFCQAGRGVRPQPGHLRQRDPVVQHHHLDGAADAQHPAVLRPVRARGDRRAHPGQVRGLPPQGHVDGRLRPARLRGQEPQAGGRSRPRPSWSGGCSPGSPRTAPCSSWSASLAADGARNKQGKPIEKGYALPGAAQPGLHRRRPHHKGTLLPGRAPADHRPRALGQGPRHPEGEPAQARRRQPRAGPRHS